MKETSSVNDRSDDKRKQLPLSKGAIDFLLEMYRLSNAPRLLCFCTPGHQRGAIANLISNTRLA
jgi:hypothetical protein